jgi:hypothetical protein
MTWPGPGDLSRVTVSLVSSADFEQSLPQNSRLSVLISYPVPAIPLSTCVIMESCCKEYQRNHILPPKKMCRVLYRYCEYDGV